MRDQASSESEGATTPTRRWVWSLLSYGIAVGCLAWVFHDISLSELLESLHGVRWWWLLPAAVLDLLVYVLAAWEWQWLLRPVGHLSLAQTARAVFAGRFANDILPVHAGYIIRVYLASRWLEKNIAAILPSLLIERLLDSFWLAVGIGVTTLFFPLPANLARAGEVLGGSILAGVVVVSWIILRKHNDVREKNSGILARWKPVRKLRAFVGNLAHGLRSIGRSYLILAALGFSILKLITQALAFLTLLQAYDFPFSVWLRLAVFMITYIGISMPSTPASLGVFQLFCAAGLMFFGVPKPTASGFALLAFVVLTAPLTLAGLFAVARSGVTWRQLRQEVRRWKPLGK